VPATASATRAEDTAALRERGLRVTRPRLAVLDALAANAHLPADAVTATVREALGNVSTQAVYDVLTALAEAGLVRRIEPAGSPSLYERRTGDNHHHVVCRVCRAVEDIDCAVGLRPCLTPPAPHARVDAGTGRAARPAPGGYLVDEAEVLFWGLCPNCQLPPDVIPAPAGATPPRKELLP
jgi:Fur family ferric uptake transcriptional regulator